MIAKNTMIVKNTISRRQLMRYAAISGAGLFVAACAPTQVADGEPAVADAAGGEVTLSVIIAPESEYGEITPETALWQYYTELTGVKFEITQVPWGTLGQQVSLKVASGDMPTIMIADAPPDSGLSALAFANKYGAEGAFVQLDQYIDSGKMPNLVAWRDQFPDLAALLEAPDGHTYGAPEALFIPSFPALLLRTDLLAQGGVIEDQMAPPPSAEIITTVDDLYNALESIQQQMGGAPVLGNRFGPPAAIAKWGAFFGTGRGAYFNPASKQYEAGPLGNRYRVMVEFLNRIYASGILHPEYSTMADEDLWAKWDQGESGAVADNISFSMGRLKETIGVEAQDMFVQSPTIDGERVLWPRQNYWLPRYPLVISSSASPEQIEASIQLIDFLYSQEAADLTWFGKKGVDWELDDDGKLCLTGNHECPCYPAATYCGGEAPAEGTTSYAALGLKNSEGDLPRLLYPEFYYNSYMPLMTEAYPNRWQGVIDQFEESGSMTDALIPLTFTAEEQETLAQLTAPLDSYILEESQKFIEGLRPLNDDEWSAFTAGAEDLAIAQVVDIYNAALARTQ